MEDFELTLFDRLEVIKTINKQYDLENNSYISFSGGKDSTILHYLIDLALPNNNIPRVFIDTGIEYNLIKEFAYSFKEDKRFIYLKPTQNIKNILNEYGYPFKSKEHSLKIGEYQKGCRSSYVLKYKNGDNSFSCPKQLLYQFDDDFKLKLSDKCCHMLKKQPIKNWQKQNNRKITLTGMRKEEKGQRTKLSCIVTDKEKNLIKFHPLAVVSEDWEEWFIKKYNIKLCKLYYEPFNFKRTGCKGCPLSLDLQKQLDIMQKLLPNEYKQCEVIWKPVYEEYRRINYRLKRYNQLKLFDLKKGG